MVQVLACNLALSDQAAVVAHRVQQRLTSPALGRPAPSLAGEGDKGGAVAVVVLEAPRAQLGAGGLGL